MHRSEIDESAARYWAGNGEDSEYGIPDEVSPEITEEDILWSVSPGDFASFEDSIAFLKSLEAFLNAAAKAGIPKETFPPFEPSKPGFEERAKALMALPKAVGWAAE